MALFLSSYSVNMCQQRSCALRTDAVSLREVQKPPECIFSRIVTRQAAVRYLQAVQVAPHRTRCTSPHRTVFQASRSHGASGQYGLVSGIAQLLQVRSVGASVWTFRSRLSTKRTASVINRSGSGHSRRTIYGRSSPHIDQFSHSRRATSRLRQRRGEYASV